MKRKHSTKREILLDDLVTPQLQYKKREYSEESETLLDDLVTYITNFVPRSDWFSFQMVSKQFLRCSRKRNLTAIKPNYNNLTRVCQKGNCQSLILLVGVYEMDPSYSWNEAIIFACTNGHEEVVALLLADPRVDPSKVCRRRYMGTIPDRWRVGKWGEEAWFATTPPSLHKTV